jgi:hypothetical protein
VDDPKVAQSGGVFKTYDFFPKQLIGTLVLFVMTGVALVVISATGATGPGWTFTGFWLAALAWTTYWSLFRLAWKLQIRGDVLEWSTAVRSGSCRIADIQEVRNQRLQPTTVVIRLAHRRSLLVIPAKGLEGFLTDLAHRAPDLPIHVSRLTRMHERLPGRSWYHRSD